jgi:two-component system sensor histidine kinase BaeS
MTARTHPLIFGLTAKLFLAILTVAIIVIMTMAAALRWNFERDFFSYIQAREARRAERIEASLAGLYLRDNSWELVQRHPAHWRHLLSVSPVWPPAPQVGETEQTEDLPAVDADSKAPRNDRMLALDPNLSGHFGEFVDPIAATVPTELFDTPLTLDKGASGPAPLPGFLIARAPTPTIRAPLPPYTLLSAEQAWLAGAENPPANAPRRPIRAHGETVGWLITPAPERMPDDADLHFQTQQREATWIMGLLAIVLAAVASIGLARVVLAPVRRLGRATHALVAGDYSSRVKVTSSDELSQLAEDFNRLAATLQRNEGLRREWFADISHELRTPLAIMRGELEALQDNIRPITPQALQSLQAEVTRLNKLIDDLYELALSDVGALSYRMAPVALHELIGSIVRTFATRAAGQNIEIKAQLRELPDVSGDAQRLTQLIRNLLENALRYTNAPGRIELHLSRQGREARLDIQDSPPGVPDEALPRLFDRLFRLDPSRSRISGGAGLGLAICERIVDSHQGTIQAMHSPLGGLLVRITLPLCFTSEADKEPRRPS